MRPTKAGAVYAVGVFAIGFVAGAVRVLFVEPRVGPLPATLLELPVMLFASWHVAGDLIDRFEIARITRARLVMGVSTFAILLVLEAGTGAALGRPPFDQLAQVTTAAGLAGLLGQVAFAMMPLFRLVRTRGRE